VRDKNFTSGGRGPLHRRRSRVEGKDSTLQQPSPLPDNAHAPTNHPAAPFTGGATLDGHRVRRGTGAWGDPRPKSGALQRQILKFSKGLPGHPFEDILPISLNVSKASNACMAQMW